MGQLQHKRVAMLATHGFEERSFTGPRRTLIDAGAQVTLIGPRAGAIHGWAGDERTAAVPVDRSLRKASEADHDALVIVDGLRCADRLRADPRVVAFVRSFFAAHKPVAAIGYGVQVLIEADVVRGRTLTAAPSLRTDVLNAGGHWTTDHAIVDEGLVTTASIDEPAAFDRKLVEEIWEGKHAGQTL